MRGVCKQVFFPLVLALAVMACAPSAKPSETGASAGQSGAAQQRTLVISNRGEPPSLAARSLVTEGSSLGIPPRFFNATLDLLDVREEPHPQLAESLPEFNTDSWQVFPDGTMETRYTLRPNLTWHDGQPLTPEDFAFALRVYKDQALGSANTRPIPEMDSIVVNDPRTFTIRWKSLYADAGHLANTFQALPRHLLEDDFDSMDPVSFTSHSFWTTDYVGLGPYKLDQWESGTFLEGSAFDNHALGRPKIDRIRIMIINDPQTAMANVLAGEVDYVTNFTFSVDQGQVLEQSWADGKVLYSPTQRRLGLIQMRPEYQQPAALGDARVRYAIAFGMDNQARVDVLDGGKGKVAYTMASPGLSYYPELEKAVVKRDFDPRRAKELMGPAGWTLASDGFFVDGSGNRFPLEVASSAGGKNEQEAAIYVDSLRKVGFDAVQYVTPVGQINDNESRVTRGGLSLRGAGQQYENYLSSAIPSADNRWRGNNRPGWSNPDFDQTFARLEQTFIPDDRVRLMAHLEELISKDAPIMMNSWESAVTAVGNDIEGVDLRMTPDASGPEPWIFKWEWKS